ncbi:hypothetical protein Y032_0525g2925 [Ancylostoma ceylanicum]|uniref:Uncharacterized protein n=1 Tax=Ancylostoma ceylanicum TaxID=53326 RepID=A0A016WSN9_9BILA|nr:hypothetical protein Y032_0525g2925 [Ancylostoma ceylanicum]
MGLHTRNSGLRMLYASRKGAMDAWRTARTAMSQSFASLIHWFSKIIGEAEAVLYASFMILELQIVDRKKFEELKQSMIDGRIYPIETTKLHRYGDRTYKTHYVSAAEDVSEAHEVDIVRIGLPKYWESGTDEAYLSDDSDEDLDYTSDSSTSTNSESDSSDLSYNEVRARIKDFDQMRRGTETSSNRVEASLNPEISKSTTTRRDPQDHQCDVRAFDFDTVWMLVAMRYW